MRLVELVRLTAERRHLEPARVTKGAGSQAYAHGDTHPLDSHSLGELGEFRGHAARIAHLEAGAADIYAETGAPDLRDRLTHRVIDRGFTKLNVTSGVGARNEGEAFGKFNELASERDSVER